jgi:RNA polymerase-binding transcription factor DksA
VKSMFEAATDAQPKGSSHLSAEELAQLHEQLLRELAAQVDQASEQEQVVAALLADPREALGQLEVVRDVADVVVVWSEAAANEIEAALARMGDGSYGICEQCAAPIRVERLVAIPHARYCVACQGRRGPMR